MGRLKKVLILIFFSAFVLRLSVSLIAYHGDLNNNISWGTLALERGLNGFYGSSDANDWPYSAPNQPPLSIILFAGIRLIWVGVRSVFWYLNWELLIFPSKTVWFWDEKGMAFLIKLPSIIADLGIGWLIYRYIIQISKFKNHNPQKAIFLASVWLFNPITWYNSSIWGQTDSIVNFLGLAAILQLLRKNLTLFLFFLTLSLLFKGSLAIFVPILLFVAISQRYSLTVWLKAVFFAFVATVLISVWFHPQFDLVFWLVNLYQKRILPGEIGYLTANAFNFWWLIDSGKRLDSMIYFGLPARVWGFAIVLAGISFIIFWLKRKINPRSLFVSLSIVSLLSFLFLTRVHERYLYPFFPAATILLSFNSILLIPYVVLVIIHLLNLYHLFWGPPIPVLINILENGQFKDILSLVTMVVFGIYAVLVLRSEGKKHI